MKVSIIMPSLWPPLAARAIASLNATTIPLEIVITGPQPIDGPNVKYIPEVAPQGLCAAQRRCFQASTGDICTLFSDDQTAVPGWLDKVIPTFLDWSAKYAKDNFILGPKAHFTAVGTCFGRFYATYPFFWRELGHVPHPIYPWSGVNHDLGPEYLRSQWSDVALSMSVWEKGGVVRRFPEQLVFTPDDRRMGLPEGNRDPGVWEHDTQAFIDRFRGTVGLGWPCDVRTWRGFNIDAWSGVIDSENTCNVPNFWDFMQLVNRPPDSGGDADIGGGSIHWRCRNHRHVIGKERLQMPLECSLNAELTA
jgi:hypothetical protein